MEDKTKFEQREPQAPKEDTESTEPVEVQGDGTGDQPAGETRPDEPAEAEQAGGSGMAIDIERLLADESGEGDIEGSTAVPTSGAGEGLVRALAELARAKDDLERARSQAKSGEERLLRMAADIENYKKRVARERSEERKFANERLVRELLPIVDNLERALQVCEAPGGEQILSGVKMVYRQLLDTLTKFGVEQFSAEGEAFDPEFHDAMQQVETTSAEPGTVVSEFQKGFMIEDRLLRPAMVVVAKAPEVVTQETADAPAQGAPEKSEDSE